MQATATYPQFTDRQIEVLSLVARRLTIKEIAAELGVSESAINQRIRTLKEKARVNTHRELAQMYLDFCAEDVPASPYFSEKTCSDSACRISQLEASSLIQNEGTESKSRSAFSFHDSQLFRSEAPWLEIDEPRVVPRVLDGPNAVWFRIVAIFVIAVALMVSVIVGLATLQAITNAIESGRAVPAGQTAGLPFEHGEPGRIKMKAVESIQLAANPEEAARSSGQMAVEISAIRIARELRDTEFKLDDALLASAKLMQTMITARKHPDVEVHTGQKALIRLVRAQQSIIDGTSDMFRVHDEMLSVNRELSIMDEDNLTSGSGLSEVDLSKAA